MFNKFVLHCVNQKMMLLVKRYLSSYILVHLKFWISYISLQFRIHSNSIIFSKVGTVRDSVHSFHSAHVPRLGSNSVIRSSWEAKAVASAVLVEPIWGQDGWMDGWMDGMGRLERKWRGRCGEEVNSKKNVPDFFTWENYWVNIYIYSL